MRPQADLRVNVHGQKGNRRNAHQQRINTPRGHLHSEWSVGQGRHEVPENDRSEPCGWPAWRDPRGLHPADRADTAKGLEQQLPLEAERLKGKGPEHLWRVGDIFSVVTDAGDPGDARVTLLRLYTARACISLQFKPACSA